MTPNKLVLTFRGSYVCANFGENRSRNATVRVLADGRHTDRQTDTQTQTDFIICPMLYAIAMGQITMYFVLFLLFLCLSLFVSLSVSYFLVASFDGLQSLLVTSHCSLRSLANKLRSFVLSEDSLTYYSASSDSGTLLTAIRRFGGRFSDDKRHILKHRLSEKCFVEHSLDIHWASPDVP